MIMENEMTIYDSDFSVENVMENGESYGNAILDKSLSFAVRVIKFYKIKIKNNYELQSLIKKA